MRCGGRNRGRWEGGSQERVGPAAVRAAAAVAARPRPFLSLSPFFPSRHLVGTGTGRVRARLQYTCACTNAPAGLDFTLSLSLSLLESGATPTALLVEEGKSDGTRRRPVRRPPLSLSLCPAAREGSGSRDTAHARVLTTSLQVTPQPLPLPRPLPFSSSTQPLFFPSPFLPAHSLLPHSLPLVPIPDSPRAIQLTRTHPKRKTSSTYKKSRPSSVHRALARARARPGHGPGAARPGPRLGPPAPSRRPGISERHLVAASKARRRRRPAQQHV